MYESQFVFGLERDWGLKEILFSHIVNTLCQVVDLLYNMDIYDTNMDPIRN